MSETASSECKSGGYVERAAIHLGLLLSALVLPLAFIDLLPLSEFRDWLTFFQRPEVWQQNLGNLLTRETTYSRNFSIMLAGVADFACADNLRCVNAIAFAPQILSVLLLYALLRKLDVAPRVAALFVSLWAISVPMLATAAWQATILDRVGMCVALAGLWHAASVSRQSNARLVLASMLQLLACFAALNSKEAYWFYPIAAATLIAQMAGREGGKLTRRRITFLIAPMLLYSLWFAIRYASASTFASGWGTHVGGGDIGKNLSRFVEYAFGSWFALSLLIVMTAVAMGSACAKLTRDRQTVATRFLWFVAIAALAYAPASRTVAASPYYFAPSLAFAFGALAVVVTLCLQYRHRTLLTAIVVISIASQVYAHSKEAAAILWERRAQSAQFIAANFLPAKVDLLRDAEALCFTTDRHDPAPHFWTQADSAYSIFRFAITSEDNAYLRRVKVIHTRPDSPAIASRECVQMSVPYPALPRNVFKWLSR